MVPVIVATSPDAAWTSTTTCEPTLPAGTGSGDLLIASILARFGDRIIALASGYTLITTDNGTGTDNITGELQAKVAGPGESAPTITTDLTTHPTGAPLMAVRDWSGTLGDLVVGGSGAGSGSTAIAPAVTATEDDSLILRVYLVADDNTVITPPAGHDLEFSDVTEIGGDGAIYIYSATQASAGDTGTASLALSGSDDVMAFTVAVPPAGVDRPTGDAGPDQTVAAGATDVQLSGAASGGAGAPFTHTWRIVSDTTGGASLSSTSAESPTVDIGPNGGTTFLGYVCTDSADVDSNEDTVTITALGAGASALPVSDEVVTDWSEEPDDGSPLASSVSDKKDSTYIYYEDPVGNVVVEFGLSELTTPNTGDSVTVWFEPSMFSGSNGSVAVILKEGATTVIASFDPDEWTSNEIVEHFEHSLSPAQISSVGDWGNLRLRLEGTVT